MKKQVKGKMIEITCACGCGRKRMVRVADVKRGWGKYFCKSCKAVDQERRTGQYAAYKNRTRKTCFGVPVSDDFLGITDQDHDQIMSESEMGWDGHKHW